MEMAQEKAAPNTDTKGRKTRRRQSDALKSDAARRAGVGAEELAEGADMVELGSDLNKGSAGLLAAGVADLTRAEDIEKVAARVAQLSEVAAAAGAIDVI